MSTDLTRFDGGIPENYDEGLGPHIFVDFGRDLAARVQASHPGRVLEMASGTGIVTQLLRETLDDSCELVATDLSEEMLAVARRKLGVHMPVRLKQADALALPFEDEEFDVVCCQFGVMFFPDKEASYREALRVLKPGGRYVFSTWCSFEHNPFSRLAYETTSGFFKADPPEFYRLPFTYHDINAITTALSNAGFHDVKAETVSKEKVVEDYDLFSRGLVFGNPIAGEIRDRGGVEPETVRASVADALRGEFGPEPSTMPLQAIVFEATRP